MKLNIFKIESASLWVMLFWLSLHFYLLNYAFFPPKAGSKFTKRRRKKIFLIKGLNICITNNRWAQPSWLLYTKKKNQMATGVFCISALLEWWIIWIPSFVPQLSRAEQRMNRLDQCYCERTCTMKGTTYREFESWTDGCKNCTCLVWLPLGFRLRKLWYPDSLKIY